MKAAKQKMAKISKNNGNKAKKIYVIIKIQMQKQKFISHLRCKSLIF
jgi:hypothetical protein